MAVALTAGGLSLADTSHGKVFVLSTPEDAVSILGHLAWYGRHLKENGPA